MRNAHVAITLEAPNIVDARELARTGAAIQRQLLLDFAPAWGIHATVDVFPRLEDVPEGYWPVVLTRRHLGDDEGFHLAKDGAPFAIVEAITGWSLTASHEILEMLVDPTGTRMVAGPNADYLVEICDPCQSARDSYVIDGVVVSDFVFPSYFDVAGVAPFSFTGSIGASFGLTPGGAITSFDRAQRSFVHTRHDGRQLITEQHELGGRVPRAAVHALVKRRSDIPRLGGAEHTLKTRDRRKSGADRAAWLQSEIATLGGVEPLGLWRVDDDEVKRRITSALSHREALPAPVVELLQQAAVELATGRQPMRDEQFALSLVRSLGPVRSGLLTARDVPGLGEYEHEDVRWAKALLEYALHAKAPFPVCPATEPPELMHAIPEDAVIAIAGDWGTHNESSARIGQRMTALRPTHTIHLGDVYYAGTDDEERKFVQDWPAGASGSFTLNSNHEMYSGGHGYFSIALRSEKFGKQTYSYFALYNSSWLFIGIDSAYEATKNGFVPYEIGHLRPNDPQVAWLRRVLRHPLGKQTDGRPKRLCVFSHHHALEPNGTETPLFNEVRAALEGRVPELWYWVHVHGAAAYEVPYGDVAFRGRLAAHGGVPYLSELDPKNDASAHIVWAERPNGNAVGPNGFAVLRLASGGGVAETFYDEAGVVQYTTTT